MSDTYNKGNHDAQTMDEFFALFDDVDPNEAESKADKPVTASRSSRLNANARTAEEEAYRAARHNKTDDAASAGAGFCWR